MNHEAILQNRKLPSATEQNDLILSKQKYDSKRQKAIEFARNIPKPKLQNTETQNIKIIKSSKDEIGQIPALNLDMDSLRIQELEAKHEQSKLKIAALKKSLGV